MRKFKLTLVLVVTLVILGNMVSPSVCFAQDPIKKLGRGIANLTMGWFTLFSTIEDTGKSDGVYAAVTYGILKGLAKAIQRTAVGAYETISFPIPCPKGYKPILTKPEFPLGKEAKE
ncbi:MAG: exosortase system-associated protein, TIGR04073 family [Candidatus Omnitrophota bacterium]|nr:exosortase system-associated protein, TIGR04073 family [Candidatus Omnitrophota bacterium]